MIGLKKIVIPLFLALLLVFAYGIFQYSSEQDNIPSTNEEITSSNSLEASPSGTDALTPSPSDKPSGFSTATPDVTTTPGVRVPEETQSPQAQGQSPSPSSPPTTPPANTAAQTITLSKPPLSLSSVPAYSDKIWVSVNGGSPFFTPEEITTEPFELYSPRDSLNRCGVAFANVCNEIMPTEDRGAIGMVKPSGWHTVRYDDLIEDKYLYNRCHLIGFQLGGENANEDNLITGTRFMNVEGMLPFENKVANYVKSSGNHVLYRVTPYFDGENLLASGVLMEALSVEDSGKGICFCVFTYNIQPYIDIDYSNGDSARSENAPQPSPSEEPTEVPNRTHETDNTPDCDYVGNRNTKKFHYPSCSSVTDMKEKNKYYYTGSREGIMSEGYEPCKRCNP